eukprot:4733410-Pleurochrysis_carterae.AAC.2
MTPSMSASFPEPFCMDESVRIMLDAFGTEEELEDERRRCKARVDGKTKFVKTLMSSIQQPTTCQHPLASACISDPHYAAAS